MSGQDTVYVGLGVSFLGGLLSALAGIADITFGLLPVGLLGIGLVVVAAGFYEKFVLERQSK